LPRRRRTPSDVLRPRRPGRGTGPRGMNEPPTGRRTLPSARQNAPPGRPWWVGGPGARWRWRASVAFDLLAQDLAAGGVHLDGRQDPGVVVDHVDGPHDLVVVVLVEFQAGDRALDLVGGGLDDLVRGLGGVVEAVGVLLLVVGALVVLGLGAEDLAVGGVDLAAVNRAVLGGDLGLPLGGARRGGRVRGARAGGAGGGGDVGGGRLQLQAHQLAV